MSSRSTRSARSRSRAPEETVPAAAAAPAPAPAANGSKSAAGGRYVAALQVGNGLAAPNGVPPLPQVDPEVVDENGRSSRTNHYLEREKAHENGKYYWCNGEPDLRKVSAHLDTLTASDLALRGVQTQLSENVAALQGTVQALLDMNARLKREMREQRVAMNRRWVWALVAMLACTLGADALRTLVATVAWATTSPHTFFPALLDAVQTMTSWMFVLAFPLVLLLFVHKILNSYGVGVLGLKRTIVYLVGGILMQLPALWVIMQFGLYVLGRLRSAPLFDSPAANHLATIAIWLGTMLVDYVLIVLHHYVE